MSSYKDLRDEIVTLLSGLQVDGHPALAEVATAPKNKFDGMPAAVVVPAEVTSEYQTTAQNERSYGFNIHLLYALPKGQDWSDAIDAMLDLLDATLNGLDQSGNLSGLADFVNAAPMEWDIAEATSNLVLLATVHTIASVSVDV